MIIVRAPLRITLGGGGTDLPAWYRLHGGCLLTATIDKYIYFTGSERLVDKKYWLSYSQTEVCDQLDQIRHTFLRACLSRYQFPTGIEIHSISEVPGNSGLGSSGAFLVGCLTLLNAMAKMEMSRRELAELASWIEMVDLQRASGKQDQYASALGGVTRLRIVPAGDVDAEQLKIDAATLHRLNSNLLIFYSGVARESEGVLVAQAAALKETASGAATEAMHEIAKIGIESCDLLEQGEVELFGELLHRHWLAKKRISTQMSDASLDETYDFARSVGAVGGKLIGAGGGGYWMFYVPPANQDEFRLKIATLGLQEMSWNFESHGCSVIYTS